MNQAHSTPPLIYGIALVASGTVGAGMFSLPIVSAGMWFSWAVVVLAAVWFINYLATLLLLEANLLYPAGASFNTIVKASLGPRWALFNNLGIAFVMYILMYAYFSAGGSIVEQTVLKPIGLQAVIPQNIAGLVFGLIIALLVWSGASMVSKVCTVLLIAMAITFTLANSGLLLHLEIARLLDHSADEARYLSYLWAAIPYFVTSFACAGLVPSLVKYYGHQPGCIRASLRNGTLLALLVYLLWLAACFGNLSRAEMAPVIAAGGNMGDLVAALQSERTTLDLFIGLFSNFAITTSFLSIGLGLFDYLADSLGFDESMFGRSKSVIMTFLPPALLSFYFPKGFVAAIGYAGLVVVFCFYVVPVCMAVRHRAAGRVLQYRVAGGRWVLLAVLLFGLAAAAFKLLVIGELLPVYP